MYQTDLELKSSRSGHKKSDTIAKVILVVDLGDFGIGDSVVAFGKLKMLKSFLENASVDLCTNETHYAILKNNPFIDKVFFDRQQVDFEYYDIALIFSDKEPEYYEYFKQNRQGVHKEHRSSFTIYSVYNVNSIFPYYYDFMKYIQRRNDNSGQELYISKEEKDWAEKWFQDAGCSKQDKVVVLLDNSSGREKLINTDVYFEVVKYFLNMNNTRILIFDESGLGREKFYSEWLQQDVSEKFIFVKNPSLRENITLLASDFTKLIFGPCTGLLHCASGIYNTFLRNNVDFQDVPLMLTYFGTPVDGFEVNEWDWWGQSLVDAIYVSHDQSNKKTIQKLMSPYYRCSPCSEFTAEMITDYVSKHYKDKLTELGLT
ncbi:hypothetical protein C900_02805 [Fulvivirga imtechensis AK7]|uniref:Uncharacterized protein n=1 Tax=Fulvivirga imtechensis AK7 TaxID=1237149 RepID=L8JVU6_9BACT|nr:glycosyltransferase family 9 protein [Fulvivirga imtechensis]ELR71347.1 hypothetical protein C900_02805 [Fulvivirga imtechensis AK7]